MKPVVRPGPPHAAGEDADLRELRGYVPGASPAEQQAARWLLARRGGLDAAGEACLQQWLDAAPAHRQAWRDAQQLAQALTQLPAEGVAALKAGLPRRGRPAPANAGRRAWLGGLPRAGMAAVVGAAAVGGWWGLDRWWRAPVFAQAYATQRGEQRTERLPDGSSLQLDTATRMAVALYRDRRVVRLHEGQVVFDVQADAARPFEVQAGALRVTVVGTRFSVRHLAGLDAQGVVVAVEEGRVRVASPAAQDLLLRAGQAYASGLPGQAGTVSTVARAGIAPWREGRVAFDDTPLAQALAEFARYGDTRLRITDPAVAALRLSGSFDVRKMDNFAQVIQRVLPVRLRPVDDGTALVVLR